MQHRFLAGVVAAVALVAAGCGSAGSAQPTRASTSSPGMPTAPAGVPSASAGTPAGPAADGLIGADCARYADPVTARRVAGEDVLQVIREDPRLTWFTSALTGGVDPGVDYTSTLAEGRFTVFAPVDAGATAGTGVSEELRTHPARLRFLLDHHIVPGQAMSPQQLLAAAAATESGTVQTLQGWGLTAFTPLAHRGDPSALRLSEDDVAPLCGNITTANAQLYLVPTPMRPPGDYAVPGEDLSAPNDTHLGEDG